MSRVELKKARGLKGEITSPPDKSISHRAAILSAISRGESRIKNFLMAADTLSTLNALRALGVRVEEGKDITVYGSGLHGLKEPPHIIDCGNSGTTMRLLSGLLAGNPFFSVLTGDESLTKRPMGRIITPLRTMGANIMARAGDTLPPIVIKGGGLKAVRYEMPVSSAQVKSAIALAGLYAEGETAVAEPVKSRDHTERMLPSYGADVRVEGKTVFIRGGRELTGTDVFVPGDFSSASFFIVAALITPDSDLVVRDVGLNPTRTGLLDVLRAMGAEISIEDLKDLSGEPVGDLRIRTSPGLRGTEVSAHMVPSLIDELPVLCIAASFSEGMTSIRGASELRVKESDRIAAVASGLREMGVEVEEYEDGLSIKGGGNLKGAVIESHGDHRIAMAFSVAALSAKGETVIEGADSVEISFPGFFDEIERLSA